MTQLFGQTREVHSTSRVRLDGCLPCILRDGGLSGAVLEGQRERGAELGFIKPNRF